MSRIRMPALFLGHGSPMNVLEDNIYTAPGGIWARLYRGRKPSWLSPLTGSLAVRE